LTDKWSVYRYEVDMFKSLQEFVASEKTAQFPRPVNNAIAESLLLHTRILADILLSRNEQDLNLAVLLPGFHSTNIKNLEDAYGNNKIEHSPCWSLNKLLAHSTSYRGDSHDYTEIFEKVKTPIYLALEDVDSERAKLGEGESRPNPYLAVHVNLTTSSS
jgi:hypothetical protein